MTSKEGKALQQAMRLIVGTRAVPVWLEGCLNRQTRTIRAFREAEARAPATTALRERVKAFREAASILHEGLADPVFRRFVDADLASTADEERRLIEILGSFSVAARRQEHRLAEKPKQAVSYPTDSNDAISAQQLCAWTVIHAMGIINQRQIGARWAPAHDAANSLWEAAGGVPFKGQDGGGPTGWADHIVGAKAAQKARDRRAAWLQIEAELFQSQSLVAIGEKDSIAANCP